MCGCVAFRRSFRRFQRMWAQACLLLHFKWAFPIIWGYPKIIHIDEFSSMNHPFWGFAIDCYTSNHPWILGVILPLERGHVRTEFLAKSGFQSWSCHVWKAAALTEFVIRWSARRRPWRTPSRFCFGYTRQRHGSRGRQRIWLQMLTPTFGFVNVDWLQVAPSGSKWLQLRKEDRTSKVYNETLGMIWNACRSARSWPLLSCGNLRGLSQWLPGTEKSETRTSNKSLVEDEPRRRNRAELRALDS